MKTKLIALVALAAGVVPGIASDLAEGAEFEADSGDAEHLVKDGKAKSAATAEHLVKDGKAKSAATAAPTPPAKKERTLKVRVLIDGPHGKTNDLVELAESVAKQAEKDGQVDPDKAAVAYAITLPQNQPKSAN